MSGQIDIQEFQTAFLMQSIGKTLVSPLDRIKFLLQSQGELHRLGKLERPYGSAYTCFRRILALEGVGSLWRSNIIQIGAIIPSSLAQVFVGFPAQRVVFEVLPHDGPAAFTFASLASGIIGAMAAQCIAYPFDFARFRMACDIKPHVGGRYDYKHSLALFSHPNIVESPHLAYKGFSLFIMGSLLFKGVYMSMLQMISPFLPSDDDEHVRFKTIISQTAAGFFAMTTAMLWMYPLDTVRRRMMLSVNHEEYEYRSVQHCVRTILRSEGLRGFYRGALFNTFRGGLTTCLAMGIGINI